MKIDDAMSKYTDFDSDQIWDVFRSQYLKAGPAERIAALKDLDVWLEDQSGATREHADLLMRKRQLEDVHSTLRKLGR